MNSPGTVGASAKRAHRSVVFLHHNYYQFYDLARALRDRGWDAQCIGMIPPDHPNRKFITGVDIDLYRTDPNEFFQRRMDFFIELRERFDVVHMYSRFHYFHSVANAVPWDLLELKRCGLKVAYTVTGCLDGVRQSDVNRLTGGLCYKCVHQLQPDVCSDEKNEFFGQRLAAICDLIAIETDWPTPPRDRLAQAFHEPLTSCLDHRHWCPDLPVPTHAVINKSEGEFLILHSVGNYENRRHSERDIKGTGSVTEAVERLKSEGYPIRFELVTTATNSKMRFLQAQADIIVDQLNYGRYGASARQGMMLGKPVVTFMNVVYPGSMRPLRSLSECPLISASEESIYATLKELLDAPERLRDIGRKNRDYAVRWHSADACAARYEAVYDRMMVGAPLNDHSFLASIE